MKKLSKIMFTIGVITTPIMVLCTQTGPFNKFRSFFKSESFARLSESYANFMHKIERPLNATHADHTNFDESGESKLDKLKRELTRKRLSDLSFEEFLYIIIATSSLPKKSVTPLTNPFFNQSYVKVPSSLYQNSSGPASITNKATFKNS